MKTVTIICFAALLLVTLFVVPGAAQVPCNNEVGLYIAQEGTGPPRATMGYLEPLSLFLVLSRPTICETGYIPMDSVNGFELALRFEPAPNFDLFLDPVYHPQAAVHHERSDINEGVIDIQCAYGLDVPVGQDAVMLVELRFLPAGAVTTEIYLEPTLTPSVPGEMSFCAGCTTGGVIMEPVSGSHQLPVFSLQAGPVNTHGMTFGNLKALFR